MFIFARPALAKVGGDAGQGPAAGEHDLAENPAPLDMDALAVLADKPKSDRHSGEHMARMREERAALRLVAAKAAAREARSSAVADRRALAMTSTAAAQAAGLSTQKRIRKGEQIDDASALALLRCGLGAAQRLTAERQFSFVYRVEATLTDMLLNRQRQVVQMLCAWMFWLSSKGLLVVCGFNYEQDSTKMTLKASGGELLGKLMEMLRTAEALVPSREDVAQPMAFQHSVVESMLAMSGKVIVAAMGEGPLDVKAFHWHHPPLALPDGTTASLGAALWRMPLRPSVLDDWTALCACSNAVVGLACQDKASTNVSHNSLVRDVVAGAPISALFEEEWCGLHNANNLKVSSSDLCKLCAKMYSMSSVMKFGGYISGVITRLYGFVDRHLVRYVGLLPNAQDEATNRKIVDAIFALDSPHHIRQNSKGEFAKSSLLRDLEELLSIDRGSWREGNLICHCWDSQTARPLHKCREECVVAFVMCFAKLYVGRSWPLPSVAKFTNMGIVMKKPCSPSPTAACLRFSWSPPACRVRRCLPCCRRGVL